MLGEILSVFSVEQVVVWLQFWGDITIFNVVVVDQILEGKSNTVPRICE